VNLFYNRYTNLMCWAARDQETQVELWGKNAGRLTNVGIEGSAAYSHKRLSANLAFCYRHDTGSDNYFYNRAEKRVNGVPAFTLNLHASWKLLQGSSHSLKVYGHTAYTGRRLNFTDYEDTDYYVNGKAVVDLGAKYSYRQLLHLSVDCENVLNTDRYLCGPTINNIPLQQRGRTLMTSIAVHF
jgi:iron complex outermembrane receptor protein